MTKKYIVAVLLTVSILIAFGRIVGNDFINYDDGKLITQNIFIQKGFTSESIKWAFTDLDHECWHPLTSLCLMLEWRFFGDNALGYHLVSLLYMQEPRCFSFFLFRATKTSGLQYLPLPFSPSTLCVSNLLRGRRNKRMC